MFVIELNKFKYKKKTKWNNRKLESEKGMNCDGTDRQPNHLCEWAHTCNADFFHVLWLDNLPLDDSKTLWCPISSDCFHRINYIGFRLFNQNLFGYLGI